MKAERKAHLITARLANPAGPGNPVPLFIVTSWSIFVPMKLFSHRIFSILGLVLYLGGNVLIEAAHHDEANTLLRSTPMLESHDCGAKEIHIAWEDARHCIACSHFTQRLSIEASAFSGTNASMFLLTVVPTHAEQTLEIDLLHSGKRGPPRA